MVNSLLFYPKKASNLEITTAVPVDDQFSAPRQIRWSTLYQKLLVTDNTNYRYLIRNADLSFYSKFPCHAGYNEGSFGIDSDSSFLFGGRSSTTAGYVAKYDPATFSQLVVSATFNNLRNIDASGDPLHVYVTSNNATVGHGVRMITKSTMAVTLVGGNPVQILATGTGNGQFTDPLGVFFVSTGVGTGDLFICEATRIVKLAVVTTAGSESLTWTTSYAIAAFDLCWDGTNWYVQSATQTLKYVDYAFSSEVHVACVGYSITYIPDQGDGNGATLGIVDNANSHIERRKCSDLSAINSVGSSGDGSASLFDPTFTTSVSTQITYTFDDGFSYTTPSGTSHALSWNGFAGYSFKTAGPHTCKIKCAAGLGAITGIDCSSDYVATIRNLNKLGSLLNFNVQYDAITLNVSDAKARTSFIARSVANLNGNTLDFMRSLVTIQCDYCTNLKGLCGDIPTTISQALLNNTGVSASSIANLISITGITLHNNGWLTADVDLVLMSVSDALLADPNHYTYPTPSIYLGGTNQAPSGIYQAPSGVGGHAVSGLEAVYAMVHNTGTSKWSVTVTGSGPYAP